MDYLAVKHSHMAIAMLSVILFYVRSFSRMGSGKLAKNKLVFIGSHGIDTLLLVSALMLKIKITDTKKYPLKISLNN